jgi:hypothetical protein
MPVAFATRFSDLTTPTPKFILNLKKYLYNSSKLKVEDNRMPNIKTNTDLKNNYNELSKFCIVLLMKDERPLKPEKNGHWLK